MAQQIVLRIHADRRGRRAVAVPPACHLDVHEERGVRGASRPASAVLVGSRDRLITDRGLSRTTREPFAALLLELPQRDLGGQLPAWDELVATCRAARAAVRLCTSTARGSGSARRSTDGRSTRSRRSSTRSTSRSTRISARRRAARSPARRDVDRRGSGLAGAARRAALLRLSVPRSPPSVGSTRCCRAWRLRRADAGGRSAARKPRGAQRRPGPSADVDAARPGAAAARRRCAKRRSICRRRLESGSRATGRQTADPATQRLELSLGEASFDVPLDEVRALWLELLARTEESL